MVEAVLNIKQWGNNLGVRLPVAIAREAHLHLNSRVRILVVGEQVLIQSVGEEATLSLEQRLARFDPTRHGGESMATKRIGAERW